MSYLWKRKCKIDFLINGVLASLVGITALCAYARPAPALLIGAIASAFAVMTSPLLERWEVSDSHI